MTTYANVPAAAAPTARGHFSEWLKRTGQSVWGFFSELGRRRAGAELRRLANSFELARPELAAQLRDCARENDRRP